MWKVWCHRLICPSRNGQARFVNRDNRRWMTFIPHTPVRDRSFCVVVSAIPLLAIAALLARQDNLWARAASAKDADISCSVEWVHDGDTLRCAGYSRSTRLYGIDAPEMPGACRKGRDCPPGDPYASRDHLKGLIAGQAVRCRHLGTDRSDRPEIGSEHR